VEEWAKILVGTGAGFMAGIAAEPLKFRLVLWAKTRQARSALYSDMGLIYHQLNRVIDLCHGHGAVATPEQRKGREQAIAILNSVSTGLYDHYAANEKTAFLVLPEAAAITDVYGLIRKSADRSEVDWRERKCAVGRVFLAFERYFGEGVIDEDMLLKERAQHRETTVDRMQRRNSVSPAMGPADELNPPIRDSQYPTPKT
jgi:hypothetical protein